MTSPPKWCAYRITFRDDATGETIRRTVAHNTVANAIRRAETSRELRGKWLRVESARLATTIEIERLRK